MRESCCRWELTQVIGEVPEFRWEQAAGHGLGRHRHQDGPHDRNLGLTARVEGGVFFSLVILNSTRSCMLPAC